MTGRLKEADERTKRELADKCQENGWLRRGGYPWQDDPYLEEYPYEFAKASNVEELRGFFAHGNWALRQGIVYEDLAFVHRATPEQCERLEYMEAVPSIGDTARRARDSIQQLNKTAKAPTRDARAEPR